jgi:hypothetical protein
VGGGGIIGTLPVTITISGKTLLITTGLVGQVTGKEVEAPSKVMFMFPNLFKLNVFGLVYLSD